MVPATKVYLVCTKINNLKYQMKVRNLDFPTNYLNFKIVINNKNF